MSRPLKVFRTLKSKFMRQHEIIVATPTKKAAYEAMKRAGYFGSYKVWDQYVSETGNPESVAAALASPGAVLMNKKSINDHTDPEWEIVA